MNSLFFNQAAHIGALEFASVVMCGKQYDTNNEDYDILIDNDAAKIIISVVCDFLEVPYSSVLIRTRKRPIVFARQCIGYFMRKFTRMPLHDIAPHMGLNNHATVIHSIDLIEDLCSYDAQITRQIRRMRYEIEERINLLNINNYA